MSASSTDSREAMPQDEPIVPEHQKQDLSTSGKPSKSPGKPRARKPRPTFEDGSLSRVFKFPSKTYPRSSYYVTADEIVIRIKKARRRWKLVVPKKRLVSYRTNRWFTKPRWVEIELTYTQAVKLKLVEPKASELSPEQSPAIDHASVAQPTPDPKSDTSPLKLELSLPPPADCAAPLDMEADSAVDADESDGEGTDDAMTISEEDVAEDPAEEWDEPASEDLGAETTDGAADEEAQELAPLAASQPLIDTGETDPQALEETTIAPVVATAVPPAREERAAEAGEPAPVSEIPEDRIEAQQQPIRLPAAATIAPSAIASQPTQHTNSMIRERRFDARLWASTLMLTAAAAGWIAVEEWRASTIEPAIACGPRGNIAACADPIVTGSLARQPEIEPAIEPAPPATARQTIEPVESPPPQTEAPAPAPPPLAAPMRAAPITEAPVAPAPVREPGTAEAITQMTTPEPVPAIAPEPPKEMPQKIPAAACTELVRSTPALSVHFEFASSSLDQLAVATLANFATRLRGCSSAAVTIEGHTDADGDAERNQALSVRRANEVVALLSSEGLDTRRFAVVGFGPSRPQAPNNTPENKQANRRVTIKIDALR